MDAVFGLFCEKQNFYTFRHHKYPTGITNQKRDMLTPTPDSTEFKPYIAPGDVSVKEFTVRAVVLGALFGILFGAATVYLALKAGLTVSASIPIAVLAISLGRRFLGTTILENNIIQTTGSAGESVAAGVVFTLPAFLFLSDGIGKGYFSYWTILMLAIFGGILGVLMMIPLRNNPSKTSAAGRCKSTIIKLPCAGK